MYMTLPPATASPEISSHQGSQDDVSSSLPLPMDMPLSSEISSHQGSQDPVSSSPPLAMHMPFSPETVSPIISLPHGNLNPDFDGKK